MQANGALPPNYKIFKKEFLNPKTFVNFRNSLKISLSQYSLSSHNKQKNMLLKNDIFEA